MKSLLDTLDITSRHSRSTVEAVLATRRGELQYKAFNRTWPRADVIRMLGIAAGDLARAESALDISPIKVGLRYEYTLAQIHRHVWAGYHPVLSGCLHYGFAGHYR